MSIEQRLKQEALKKKVKKTDADMAEGMATAPTPSQQASVKAKTQSALYADPQKAYDYAKVIHPESVVNEPINIQAGVNAPITMDASEETYYNPTHLAELEGRLDSPSQSQDGVGSQFVEENKDWMIAGATPLLVGLLMGNAGDAFDVASKGILDIEKRKYEEDVKKQSFARKLALASAQKKKGGLVKTMGPDGKPVYTRQEDAVGKEAYEKGTSFHLDEKKALETHKAGLKGLESKLDSMKDNNKMVDALRKERDMKPLTKNTAAVAQAYDRVLAGASGKNAASDLGMVFAFMKLLDPTSVVRESEQITARKATGKVEAIKNLEAWFKEGRTLNSNQIKRFVAEAKKIHDRQQSMQDRADATFKRIAKKRGLPWEDIVTSYRASAPDSTEGQVKLQNRLKEIQDRKAELNKQLGR